MVTKQTSLMNQEQYSHMGEMWFNRVYRLYKRKTALTLHAFHVAWVKTTATTVL